jgi:ABC-type dipeptide/oligopeptide/nickel transport system permease component
MVDPMLRFALRRILQFIPTILAITLILFVLLNILPGDAALMSGDARDKGVDLRFVEEMRKRWGLDQPIHIRYLTYLKNLASGDMGLSYLRREKVSGLIAWPWRPC